MAVKIKKIIKARDKWPVWKAILDIRIYIELNREAKYGKAV
jgi:hypothetical protein